MAVQYWRKVSWGMQPMNTRTAVWVDDAFQAGSGEAINLYNPSTGEVAVSLLSASDDETDYVVAASQAALTGEWAAWTPMRRGALCLQIAHNITQCEQQLVDIVVEDTGLPVWMARADVRTAIRYFGYYAGLADKLTGQAIPLGPSMVDFTVREPWGVCAVVLPFNVPVQMAARSVAAALITGNTVVLKPAEQAPLAQIMVAAIIAEAGAPTNVVTAVVGNGNTVGHRLISHRLVNHITFTGSLPVGKRIMATAAERVTPLLLELGGKSPHIILSDGDLDLAIPAIVASGFRSAGQVCSAGSRVLVERDRHDELLTRLSEAADGLQIGPARDDPDVGPVISAEQRDTIIAAVGVAQKEGADRTTARALTPRTDAGYFINPTVLSTDDPQNYAAREEIFGPVITVVPVDSADQALTICDDSDNGLVAGVWTQNISSAHRIAAGVKAGQVYVNTYGVGGGVELPFGGYRRSGFGRLKGVEGALEYTQLKNVCIAL
jgi:aldehyde dehydrogenase (NAD+)